MGYNNIEKNQGQYLNRKEQFELHDSKLELKIHTILAAISNNPFISIRFNK